MTSGWPALHKKQVLTYLKLSGLPVGASHQLRWRLAEGEIIERLVIANAPQPASNKLPTLALRILCSPRVRNLAPF